MDDSKKQAKIRKIVKNSLIAGAVVTVASFVIKLMPCTTEGNLNFCWMPSPFTKLANTTSIYYGLTNNPITGLILQFAIPAAAFGIIAVSIKKKKMRIVDLTRK